MLFEPFEGAHHDLPAAQLAVVVRKTQEHGPVGYLSADDLDAGLDQGRAGALDQGRADVSIRGAESIRYVTNEQEPGKYALIGSPITEIPVGIGVAKDQTELRDAVVEALAALMEDGTYAEIGERWGLSDILRPEVTVNGAPTS